MKKFILRLSVVVGVMALGFLGYSQFSDAATSVPGKYSYTGKIGAVTVTVSHCSPDGWCISDNSKLMEIAKYKYALAIKNGGYYSFAQACGNVNVIQVSCTAKNICVAGQEYRRNTKCGRVATGNTCGGGGTTITTTNTTTDTNTDVSCSSGTIRQSDGSCKPIGECTEDEWTCSGWSACNAGNKNRTCNMTYDCSNATTPSPATSQFCTAADDTTGGNGTGGSALGDVSLSVTPPLISQKQRCTLDWESENATSCTLIDSRGNVISTDLSNNGLKTAELTESTNYTLTCTDGVNVKSKTGLCRVLKNVQEF